MEALWMHTLRCVLWFLGLLLFSLGFLTLAPSVDLRNTEVCQVKKSNSTQHVDQVIFIVVDAMRADFVLPLQNSTRSTRAPRFRTIAEEIATCADCVAFGFVADPPTITSPRIKAMMTGSIPTYLEAASNFNSIQVTMDNLMDHMHRLGKKKALLGDWIDIFNETYWETMYTGGRASLEILDFDIVDDIINENLIRTICVEDYDFIVAHFLGVDFIGHAHHALHPIMDRKIEEIDAILRNAISELRRTAKKSLVIVVGDHGMDDTGNHAGTTFDEATSFLFAKVVTGDSHPAKLSVVPGDNDDFRKKSLIQEWTKLRREADEPKFVLTKLDDDASLRSPGRMQETLHLIPQVDITSTLAIILSLPIPSNNLGRIIPEILSLIPFDKEEILQSYRCNAEQVQRYLDAHAEIPRTSVPTQEVQNLLNVVQKITSEYDIGKDLRGLIGRMHSALGSIHRTFHKQLATYNHAFLGLGSLILFVMVLDFCKLVMCTDTFRYSGKFRAIRGILLVVVILICSTVFFVSTPEMFFAAHVACILYCIVTFWDIFQRAGRHSILAIVLIGFFVVRVQFKQGIGLLVNDDTINYVLIVFLALCVSYNTSRKRYTALFLFLVLHRIGWVGVAHRGQREFSLPLFADEFPVFTYILLGLLVAVTHFHIRDLSTSVLQILISLCFILRWTHLPMENLIAMWSTWFVFILLLVLTIRAVMTSHKAHKRTTAVLKHYPVLIVLYLYMLFIAPNSAFAVLAYGAQLFLLAEFMGGENLEQNFYTQFVLAWILYSMGKSLFYNTGHQNSTLTVDWRSAFAVLRSFNFFVSGSCVLFNTFGSDVLLALSTSIFRSNHLHHTSQRRDHSKSKSPSTNLPHLNAFICMLSAIETFSASQITLRTLRHEMLWDVFAPNFIFLAAGSIFSIFTSSIFVCL